MRRWSVPLAAILVALSWLAPPAARSAVLVSELCDPNLNYLTDRFIEITNTGPDSVDLTNWALIAVGNGVDIQTWTLSGVLAPGQSRVAGNSTTVAAFTVDFPVASWQSTNATWNGGTNDGAKLVNAVGTVVDRIGPTVLAFANATMVRKPAVYEPTATYSSAEWTVTAVQLATDATPGTHALTPRPPGPSIANVVTSPGYPLAGSPTHVQADVVDTVSAVTSVSLAWGTSSSSLPNTIPMTLTSGTTYATTSAIPAQVAGTTVYYKVTATDAASGITVSNLRSYALAFDLSIAQIQGTLAASPYAGSAVITHGVVTGSFGLYFTVQDGTGARSGLWARAAAAPAVGDSVLVRGTVTETDAQGLAGNTLLASAVVMSATPGATVPAPAVVPSGTAPTEAYEGVLVRIASAACTDPDAGPGQWIVNDGTGAARVDSMGIAYTPLLGTTYEVTGPVDFRDGLFAVVPRDAADIVWVGDTAAPVVNAVGEMSDSTFLVQFSEPVATASSQSATNYAIGGLSGTAAAQDSLDPSHVWVTIPNVPAGPATLTVTGVQDPFGNATAGAARAFTYVDVRVPAGYYDAAAGLHGTALRAALKAIIDGHTVKSYDYAYTAFQTTDVRPDGKVWDVYSDIPGGTPPYEYDFSQNPGGGTEGSGYNREHSWPQAWFGGGSPMYSDLWILYPTDAKVNEYRSNYPYGVVGTATITSLNGSRLGSSSDPGYAGTVFEPIDAFKGDLARSTFYVATRYFGEDAGWPGSPATSGADPLPWASTLYSQWSTDDPVSWKERLRNGAIYVIQGNRNPFVDHPEWVRAIYDSSNTAGVDDAPPPAFRLHASAPNPFTSATTLRFDLPRRERVSLRIHDVAGRLVRTLAGGTLEPGRHTLTWDGRDDAGRTLGPGLYFYRLEADGASQTRRVVRMR